MSHLLITNILNKFIMITTEQIKKFFRENNYQMYQSSIGYFFVMKGRKLVWMDAACEDAWEFESALQKAYSIITEGA